MVMAPTQDTCSPEYAIRRMIRANGVGTHGENLADVRSRAVVSYWQTVKEWNTFWYSLVWFVFVFPVGKLTADAVRCFRSGDYGGILGVLLAGLLFAVVIYFAVALFRYGYKVYRTPADKLK